ncbi:hypothetical protein T03_10692 [Trichinella britovi]|uniref:Uncharacterized protein n=3 Tax=Trichinella TaxID=6333 RepID=A0A0V1C9V8_TRIBR|nr:hypothetical protein T05_10821 [Trichinella murrelli]KRY10671.1 hypothetical protein T12_765 [Trichinella patagoniensis]KRY46105.1 hypothetical protein T03_10692 [Trichinella britovi]
MQRDNSLTFFALENEKSAVISLVVITGDALFVKRENVKYQCQIFYGMSYCNAYYDDLKD